MNEINQSALKEVIFEINFIPSNKYSWDLTFYGKFYDLIEDEYKEKNTIRMIKDPTDNDDDELYQTETLMRFIKQDNSRIVQIAENKLVFNVIPTPYPGWATLKQEVIDQISNYKRICKPKEIKSIGIRYVNRFEMITSGFDLSNFFRESHYLPAVIFQNKLPFFMHFEQSIDALKKIEINIGTVKHNDVNETALIFDLEIYSTENCNLDNTIVEEQLENFHDYLNKVFLDCISDHLKSKFEIKKD